MDSLKQLSTGKIKLFSLTIVCSIYTLILRLFLKIKQMNHYFQREKQDKYKQLSKKHYNPEIE